LEACLELDRNQTNKQPIGKTHDPQPFTTHTIELQKGDTIYIFTDGFQDQFGGEKGKKFKASQLKEILLSIQAKTMEEQKTILDNTFENWKNNLEQVDDVCMIGVRL
jgi:serine phosphatase RsbU (regulator of sigma subunit)